MRQACQNAEPELLQRSPLQTPNKKLSETEKHFDAKTGSDKFGIIFGFSSPADRGHQSPDRERTSSVLEMRQYEIRWDLAGHNDTLTSHKINRNNCCLYWNLGFACGPFMKQAGRSCLKHHICSHDQCRNLSDTDHRAIQHPPVSICQGHREKLVGMNKLHDRPIRFHEHSSPDDTREACEKYDVKLPVLNADLLGALLGKTDMSVPLRDSLVRGWREGLDLGSDLPEVDHLVDSPHMTEVQLEVLRSALKLETNQRRLCGPLTTPIRDGR